VAESPSLREALWPNGGRDRGRGAVQGGGYIRGLAQLEPRPCRWCRRPGRFGSYSLHHGAKVTLEEL
jgi:hypothetical protein